MRRRVAFVRQLLRKSDVLMFDEPFSAQDSAMRHVLEDIIYQEAAGSGKTGVLVTHDIDSAVALSNRIFIVGRKTVSEGWVCPAGYECLRPTERRNRSDFADYVGAVWRALWEISGRA
jgi:NitT/TauT family transport system ATP-binding protein